VEEPTKHLLLNAQAEGNDPDDVDDVPEGEESVGGAVADAVDEVALEQDVHNEPESVNIHVQAKLGDGDGQEVDGEDAGLDGSVNPELLPLVVQPLLDGHTLQYFTLPQLSQLLV